MCELFSLVPRLSPLPDLSQESLGTRLWVIYMDQTSLLLHGKNEEGAASWSSILATYWYYRKIYNWTSCQSASYVTITWSHSSQLLLTTELMNRSCYGATTGKSNHNCMPFLHTWRRPHWSKRCVYIKSFGSLPRYTCGMFGLQLPTMFCWINSSPELNKPVVVGLPPPPSSKSCRKHTSYYAFRDGFLRAPWVENINQLLRLMHFLAACYMKLISSML